MFGPPTIASIEGSTTLVDGLRRAALAAEEGRIALIRNASPTGAPLAQAVESLGWAIFEPIALPDDKEYGPVTRISELGLVRSATNWHFDQSFAEQPPMWSILACVDPGEFPVPTAFCDAAALFVSLSDGLKEFLRHQSSLHEAYYIDDDSAVIAEVIASAMHPAVRRVPGATESLFVCPATVDAFEGWSVADSAPILDHLYLRMNWPEFCLTHRWSAGDVLLWPNARWAHRATRLDSGAQPRELLRLTGYW